MLIGLAGAAGAGKGSVASFLVAQGFGEIAFADPIYAAVSAMTGISVEKLKDRTLKERPIDGIGRSPRELLQLFGTEFGRNLISKSIWIDLAMQKVEGYSSAGVSVVVTDVRFDNEAQAIKDRGGLVWQVVRDAPSCLTDGAARHASEGGISLAYIDQILFNNGTLTDLRGEVDAAMSEATNPYN